MSQKFNKTISIKDSMNFFKRLFRGKNKTDSHFDKYKHELDKKGLYTIDDLKELVKPIT